MIEWEKDNRNPDMHIGWNRCSIDFASTDKGICWQNDWLSANSPIVCWNVKGFWRFWISLIPNDDCIYNKSYSAFIKWPDFSFIVWWKKREKGCQWVKFVLLTLFDGLKWRKWQKMAFFCKKYPTGLGASCINFATEKWETLFETV